MPPSSLRCASALTLASLLAALAPAAGQAPPAELQRGPAAAAPADPLAGLTGKERLAEKWTDEQRVDNCKVPLDKRGSKPRPDRCAAIPAP